MPVERHHRAFLELFLGKAEGFPLGTVKRAVNPLRRIRGVFYGWWISVAAAIGIALGNVPVFQGISVWNPVLRAHFGWSPVQLSWAWAFSRLEGGLLGPLEGMLVDRLGPRRMVLIGLLTLGTGFLLFSLVEELWQFYGAFIIMGVGASLGAWLPMMTSLNNWFSRFRARAFAVAMEGLYVGGVLGPPLMAWAIGATDPDEPERFGWRATARGIGVVILVLAFPISRVIRNRPEDYGQRPDGDPPSQTPAATERRETAQAPPSERGPTWQEALRTRNFWLISLSHAFTSVAIVTVTIHMGLMLDDRGISLQTIGLVAATMTGFGAVSNLLGGYVGDRVSIRLALLGFCSIQTVAIVVLLGADTTPIAFIFAVLMGIGWGGRSLLMTAIRGVYFGRKAFASITAWSLVPNHLFNLAVPVFAGYMYSATENDQGQGSYTLSFGLVAVMSALGGILVLFLSEPAESAPAPALRGEGSRSA